MISYLLAFFISLFLTPVVIKINKKFDLLEKPEDGKIHTSSVAKFGGITIFISAIPFMHYLGIQEHNIFLYISYFIIVVTGIIDDYKSLNAYMKILLQLCAIIIALFFIYSEGIFKDSNLMLILFTCIIIFWFLFCTNSINLIDGVDSLACGIAITILAYLSYLFYLTEEIYIAKYCLVLLAGIWGFLIFNFPAATIFLGDTGSLFIGFNISLLTTLYFLKNPEINTVLIILALCTIPILDSIFAIFRRLKKGSSPFRGDLEHIHHKLYFVKCNANFVVIVLLLLQTIITVFLICFSNMITISKFIFIYVFSILYLSLILKYNKNSVKKKAIFKIIRPSPIELTVFFVVDLACLSFILIPQWVIIIFFVFLFIPYVAIFSYGRLIYLLNVIIIFAIYLFFINYINYSIILITTSSIVLFMICIWSSNKIHFKNFIKINGDDLLFIYGLILFVVYVNTSLINSILLFAFSVILYLYNKRFLLLLC